MRQWLTVNDTDFMACRVLKLYKMNVTKSRLCSHRMFTIEFHDVYMLLYSRKLGKIVCIFYAILNACAVLFKLSSLYAYVFYSMWFYEVYTTNLTPLSFLCVCVFFFRKYSVEGNPSIFTSLETLTTFPNSNNNNNIV